jgi:hypothetical protein
MCSERNNSDILFVDPSSIEAGMEMVVMHILSMERIKTARALEFVISRDDQTYCLSRSRQKLS